MKRPPTEPLLISEWTVAEVSSALSMKVRTRNLTLDERATALSLFRRTADEAFTPVGVGADHFYAAAQFADHHELSLRAGDALHLAIARDYGATACTLDHQFAASGPVLGVRTELLA